MNNTNLTASQYVFKPINLLMFGFIGIFFFGGIYFAVAEAEDCNEFWVNLTVAFGALYMATVIGLVMLVQYYRMKLRNK